MQLSTNYLVLQNPLVVLLFSIKLISRKLLLQVVYKPSGNNYVIEILWNCNKFSGLQSRFGHMLQYSESNKLLTNPATGQRILSLCFWTSTNKTCDKSSLANFISDQMANGRHSFLVHSLGKFPTILKNNPTRAKNNGKFEKREKSGKLREENRIKLQ